VSEPSLPEKIVAIHERLTHAKIPHAFGGALALAYYAEPRATIDVDLNLFVAPSSYPDIERDLARIGVHDGVDPKVVEHDGQCRLRWGNTPIDLFFAYDALHDAMRRATRSEPFGETKIPVLAPEHLLVCKAIFNRPKDWLDIEQMLVCVDDLDLAEVRTWLDLIVGADDPRGERFERVIEACEA
jgi:Nucleotidyl transferase AbiEii toxin, Type IV TA system